MGGDECEHRCLGVPEEGAGSLGAGVTGSSVSLVSHLTGLPEHNQLLTTELSLQPPCDPLIPFMVSPVRSSFLEGKAIVLIEQEPIHLQGALCP